MNILIYSHDTYGLGHIRRALAIAGHLNGPGDTTLIMTGSPAAGRFTLPGGVDYVRLPGMTKRCDGTYRPSAMRLATQQVLHIRKALILSTIKTFRPDLFIVDKEPLGLEGEAVPGLEWIRDQMPGTRTVLGLRDVMDDAAAVREHWLRKNIYHALDRFYSEIWVYGRRDLYDPAEEYGIPENIRSRIVYAGYIPRQPADKSEIAAVRDTMRQKDHPMILVTPGGGRDGYPLIDAFLRWHERGPGLYPAPECLMVTGPFLPAARQAGVEKRARDNGIHATAFHGRMDALIGACDLLVCMGGYNTLCEAISNQTPALVIPRENPRKEQLIRARVFQENGLIEYIPGKRLTPERLGETITHMLANRAMYANAMAGFEMAGLDTILARIGNFREACA